MPRLLTAFVWLGLYVSKSFVGAIGPIFHTASLIDANTSEHHHGRVIELMVASDKPATLVSTLVCE